MEAASSPGAAPRISADVFVIPLSAGRYLVYAPLRRAAFIGNARVVNLLADLQRGRYRSESDPGGSLAGFLRELQLVDASPEQAPLGTYSGDPEPTSVSLFLTTTCNLRCTYCYASAGDTPARSMPMDVAKRGIDFVAGNAVKKRLSSFEINYHGGGEPTGNWGVLTGSLEYARAHARALGLGRPRATVASNGVLLDDQIDWIIANLDGVSLSYDGLPSVHDRHRLTVLGQGSSARVIHTMRRFDQASFPYGVRVTVTADQTPRLPDSIEFICSQFKPGRIQVEPAYKLGRWTAAPSSETDAFIEAFREAYDRARSYGREIFFSAARVGTLTNHFCGVTRDTFALSPDGNVSACYEVFSESRPFADVFFYGRPDPAGRGFRFELPVLDNLRKQAVQHREFCRGCFVKWHCAGDCYHKGLNAGAAGEFRGSDRCHITRELSKDQILAKIAESGGLFWHDPVDGGPPAEAKGKEMLL
jgi:uncharacterized protein